MSPPYTQLAHQGHVRNETGLSAGCNVCQGAPSVALQGRGHTHGDRWKLLRVTGEQGEAGKHPDLLKMSVKKKKDRPPWRGGLSPGRVGGRRSRTGK